ncbi:MAG TPA: hypothetical protein PK110_02130 [Niabella sp.]|jgi:hypothetical protein|nr:hypothetical protein [Niabella sp.]HRO83599.1 hypothetical protein [Niabella sp.]
MSTYTAVSKLINSLSPSEKRLFRLSSRKHKSPSEYIGLFDLICRYNLQHTDHRAEIAKEFKIKFPESSIDHTARYLIKLITDLLIQAKVEKDSYFKMWYGLLRLKVLQERSLSEEGFRELKKIRDLAIRIQNYPALYIMLRQELNFAFETNFSDITDSYIVETQMKAKETLRMMHYIEEHFALYELLRYRLIRLGKVESEESKKKLNDLLLSEISIVTERTRNTFESRKLHILFQSFYFVGIGDFRSAIDNFYDLNKLLEQHPHLQGHPPVDYFSSLDGILDSLRSMHHFNEMPYYINKLRHITSYSLPEYFRVLIEKTITVYSLAGLLGNNNIQGAINYIENLSASTLKSYQIVNDEKQAELCFYCSLTYYYYKDYKKAHKYLSSVLNNYTNFSQQPIYKAIRLLNMLIHYLLKDTSFLDYDIRAYRRSLKNGGTSKIVKAIIKTLQHNPLLKTKYANQAFARQIMPTIKNISKDRYERQILKYMDFTKWITEVLNV